MQQRWWLFGVGAVGIVLAILLFPRPDTGSDLPDADPGNVDPTNFNEDKPLSGAVRPGVAPRKNIPEERMIKGVKPGMDELLEKRRQPAALYSAKLQGPIGALKYALRKEGSDDARVLSDELTPYIEALRDNRRNPDSTPMDDLIPRLTETLEGLRNSEFAQREDVVAALTHFDTVLGEYREVEASGGTADDNEEEP